MPSNWFTGTAMSCDIAIRGKNGFSGTAGDGQRDNTGGITRQAVDSIRAMEIEAANCKDIEAKMRAAIGKHAFESEGSRPIRAIIDLARSLHPIPILPSQLDADPWLLNVENGNTLDLLQPAFSAITGEKICSIYEVGPGGL